MNKYNCAAKTIIMSAAAGLLAVSGARAYEIKTGTNLPPIDVHGFISQGFLYSSDFNYLGRSSDGEARFFESGLNVSMNPFARTRITAQGFMFDVGDVGQYEPVLDYALIEYTLNDHLGVRAGRIRRPSGIYNHIQDVDLARTFVLLPQGVYDARWRDFSSSLDGAELFGSFSLSKAGSISYEVYAGMQSMSDNGGVASLIRNSLTPGQKFTGIDDCQIYGGQLWWNTPLDGFRAGFAGGYLDHWAYGVNAGPVTVHTVDNIPFFQGSLEYQIKSWTFQAEYYTYTAQGHTFYSAFFPTAETKTHPDSWYVSASYRFNKWFEAGAYYNERYENADHRSALGNSDDAQRDTALTLRFDPKDWWVIKIEGHYINGTSLLQDNAKNPDRDNRGWFLLALKTTLSF